MTNFIKHEPFFCYDKRLTVFTRYVHDVNKTLIFAFFLNSLRVKLQLDPNNTASSNIFSL